MRKLIFIVSFFITCLCCYLVQAQNISTLTPELKQQLLDTTASMFSVSPQGMGSCSGTIVNEVNGNFHILTAKHCLGVTTETYFDNKPATLIVASPTQDLAYAIIEGTIKDKKVAKFSSFSANIGESIYHVSYPDEILFVSEGKIYRQTPKNDYAYLDSIHGCSGGGIFNKYGEVIGVLWGGYNTRKDSVTIMVPLREINDFLDEIETTLNIKR
jgi:S1-C subfamily serine protease